MTIKTPYYIVYEERLRKNLSLIKRVSEEADVKIIMAFKANALWKHSQSLQSMLILQQQVL